MVEKEGRVSSLALRVQAGDKIAPDRGRHRALTETSESLERKGHEKTAFLKRYLNLQKTSFYPAYLRFKRSTEALTKASGLLGEGKWR